MRQKALRAIKLIALGLAGILCFSAVFLAVVYFKSGPAPEQIKTERLAEGSTESVALEEALNSAESNEAGEAGGAGDANGASEASGATEPGTPGWQVRELETIGASFSLPKEFTKDHETPDDAVFATYDLKEKSGEQVSLKPGEVQLSIYTLEKKSDQDIATFLKTAFTSSSVNVVREEMKIGGRDALYETGKDANLYATYHIDRGDSLLSMTVYGNDADFEKNKTLLKRVIESLEIKEGAN